MEIITTLQILQIIIPILIAMIASSGFWLFVGGIRERKSLQSQLLIGLAHTEIMYLGKKYIKRGYITTDEYENLNLYLYGPYVKMGGNGTASKIMKEVDRLPMIDDLDEIKKIEKEKKENDRNKQSV